MTPAALGGTTTIFIKKKIKRGAGSHDPATQNHHITIKYIYRGRWPWPGHPRNHHILYSMGGGQSTPMPLHATLYNEIDGGGWGSRPPNRRTHLPLQQFNSFVIKMEGQDLILQPLLNHSTFLTNMPTNSVGRYADKIIFKHFCTMRLGGEIIAQISRLMFFKRAEPWVAYGRGQNLAWAHF